MSELGDTLREARLRKNMSLDDIQNITKIQKRYLEAIEEGKLDVLPGHFYARAFVKSYAEAVDLDPEQVLGYIRSELPAPPQEEPMQPLRRSRQPKPSFLAGRWLSRALLYLFAVLILFVIYIAVSKFDQGPEEEQGNSATEAPISPPVVEKGQAPAPPPGQSQTPSPPVVTQPPAQQPEVKQPETGAAALKFVTQENNIYRYELAGAAQIQLSIKAVNGDCWLRILNGGKNGQRVDELTMKKGTAKEWTLAGTSEAWIRLGSAPDVQITVNGQPLDTSQMKRQSQIISISLKP